MEYLNYYNNYIKLKESYEDDDYIHNILDDIDRIGIKGEFYHGTSFDISEIDSLPNIQIGYGDYDAIWISDDIHISMLFSTRYIDHSKDILYVVYIVDIDLSDIASLDYDTAMKLNSELDISDIRDSIDHLYSNGFSGWVTTGSIGSIIYNDYAIFDDSLMNISGVIISTDGEEWSDIMSISQVNDMLENKSIVIK